MTLNQTPATQGQPSGAAGNGSQATASPTPQAPISPPNIFDMQREAALAMQEKQRGQQAQPAQSAGGKEDGSQPKTDAPASIDWKAVDWSSVPLSDYADQIPWEKIDIKQIEKIPGVSKMQGTLRQQGAQALARVQAEKAALEKQIKDMTELIRGNAPQHAARLDQIQAGAQSAQLQSQLEFYQQQEALKEMERRLGLPANYFADNPVAEPFQAFEAAVDYHRTAGTTQVDELRRQLDEITRKLNAQAAQATDPVANADRGTVAPATNFQSRYNEYVKLGDSQGADAVRREALATGQDVDTSVWQRKAMGYPF